MSLRRRPLYRRACRSFSAIFPGITSSPTITSSSLARVMAVYSAPRTMRDAAAGALTSPTDRYWLRCALCICLLYKSDDADE